MFYEKYGSQKLLKYFRKFMTPYSKEKGLSINRALTLGFEGSKHTKQANNTSQEKKSQEHNTSMTTRSPHNEAFSCDVISSYFRPPC